MHTIGVIIMKCIPYKKCYQVYFPKKKSLTTKANFTINDCLSNPLLLLQKFLHLLEKSTDVSSKYRFKNFALKLG